MKRRKFLKTGLTTAVAPVFLNGLGYTKLGASVMPTAVCDYTDRTLVIVYLAGANDVINAMVPMNHLGSYQTERPDIYIPQNSLTTLDNSLIGTNQDLGLHPSLSNGFKNIYDDGLMAIVQRTGYSTPNRSHFASEDIMLKGIDGTISNNDQEEGWIGRFLKDRYPTYRGIPFGDEIDPLGIILGDTPNTGFHTTEAHELEINMSGQDPAGYYSIISSLSGEPISQIPNTDHGELLSYISVLEKSTQVYSERITDVFNAGNNIQTYPSSNLGYQLKTIARFIAGGSKTKVFMARKGGWDNHVDQIQAGSSTIGWHADLLSDLSASLKAFQDDLQALGKSSQVTTIVFSEFGRKIIQNGNVGTDHGTVSSMFVIGEHTNPGIYGNNIDLSFMDDQGAPDPSQLDNDYRSVFSSILQDWLGASNDALLNTFSQTPSSLVLNNIPVIKSGQAVDPTCYFTPIQPISMYLNFKLFLEGFYDSATGLMNTNLADNGLLPYNQPYGNTRYSYFGTENITSFPANTVDWVLMELWTTDNLVLDRKAVLLRNDGQIMDPLTGNTSVPIGGLYPEPFKVAIFHRSHIGVLHKNTITPEQGNTAYPNITTSLISVSGMNQLKEINGTYVMIAGDIDQNGIINSADYSIWKRANNAGDYRTTDLNADGITDTSDYELWKNNRSKMGHPEVHKLLKR